MTESLSEERDEGRIDVRAHARLGEIPEAAFSALSGADEVPFLSFAFLDALERTGCVGTEESGWIPHHLGFWRAGKLVAAAPGYLKLNSEGEFVFDHGWAEGARKLGVRYYPKLVFAVPFTPATAPRLLVAPGEDRARLLALFGRLLPRLAGGLEVSSAHVLFPEGDEAEALEGTGLAHRLGVQFHWKNEGFSTFDDFLSKFSAKRRHTIRRERREMAKAGVRIETRRGREITPEIVDRMFGYYLATVDKFAWGRQYLTRAFFEEICARVPGVEVVLATSGARGGGGGGETFLGGALNLASRAALFGRYWGAERDLPFLHFNVCYYHSIDECIRLGRSRFEPGAGGSHKVARGFAPTVTHSLHHVRDPRLDFAVRDYLVRERHAVLRAVDDQSVTWG